MFDRWMHDIALWIQARTGVTSGLIIWGAVAFVTSLTAFVFLCVAGYDWLSLQVGAALAGLLMAIGFMAIGLLSTALCAASRRRAKQRAILARAAQAPLLKPRFLDPKILGIAMNAGRIFGWQRVVPLALIAVLGAQVVRATRHHSGEV